MGDWKEILRTSLYQTWRRRWYAVGVAWAVCVLGWIGVAAIPNSYQSRTRVYVDTETMLSPLLRGMAIETNITKQVEVVQRTLLARPNIEKVLRSTDMDVRAATPAAREALIEMIEAKVKIRPEAARNLFTIDYADRDPALARNVLQAFLAIFIESNVGSQRKDMEKGLAFVIGQVAIYERQLREAEARVAQFREVHRDMLPAALGGEGNFAANMARARELLATSKRDLDDATARRAVTARQLASVPRVLEVTQKGWSAGMGRPQVLNLNTRLAEVESRLSEMMVRYTDKHPDVVEQKRILEHLQKQRKEAGEADGSNESLTERVSNPVYEQLQIKFADAETAVEMMQRRYNDQKRELERLEAMTQSIPKLEADYNDLTREYAIIKKSYTELLERRESARLSQEVDTKADKVEFRVIEPPILPVSASYPNRALLAAGVFFASIGAGIFVAYGLAQFDDSFAGARDLRNALPYPVIGTISLVTSPESLRAKRRGMVTFATACCMLVIAFGGVSTAIMTGIGTAQLAQYRQLLPIKF
jgi:polysaccharide chain length determinant protein (PEP-CTERM system associated)